MQGATLLLKQFVRLDALCNYAMQYMGYDLYQYIMTNCTLSILQVVHFIN